MFFFRRVVLFFLPLLLTLDLILIFLKEQAIPLLNGFYGGVILISAATYFFIKQKVTNWQRVLSTIFFPVLFFTAGIFYLLFVEDTLIKVSVIVLINFLLLIYFYEFNKQAEGFITSSQDRQKDLFLLLEVVIVFFISSGLFGLRDFINLSLIYLIIINAALMFVIVSYFVFRLEKVTINKIYYSLILTLVITELFTAITIFPLLYYLKGIIISLSYLLIMKVILTSQTAQLWSKKLTYLAIVIAVILTLVLLSSRWF